MPRAPSSTKSRSARNAAVHSQTLDSQLAADQATKRFGLVSEPGRRSKVKGKARAADDEAGDSISAPNAAVMRITSTRAGGAESSSSSSRPNSSSLVDARMSKKILQLAREQADEIEREEQEQRNGRPTSARDAIRNASAVMPDDDDDDDDGQASQGGDEDGEIASDEEFDEEEYQEVEIDDEDRKLLERYGRPDGDDDEGDDGEDEEGMGGGLRGNKTLADMIMDKINEAESKEASAGAGGPGAHGAKQARNNAHGDFVPPGVNEKVVEVYTKVGELLSRYKSGPLPKAFKIIPSLPSWETIIYLTNPAKWTPHATLAATRIFVSNLKAEQSLKFFRYLLLDKVRDEIEEKGKLSVHHYEALKKALYKPAAFFKGLLFPLCESGCTLKEAAIVSSVLAKVSIPVLHSAAALLRLAEMEYRGPTSLFIRVLLDKKYALPYKVVDSLVFHFLRFADADLGVEKVEGGGRRMPVLWHQSLLVFTQRYKQDLTPDQKAALLDLLRVQKHDGISPEVRRELTTGQARGEMLDEPMDDADDEAMSI